MVNIQGTKKGSIVHKWITSGKPGFCELCGTKVEKLEAHHISYLPERIIKLCHSCHHTTHFWPLRLGAREVQKLFIRKLGAIKGLLLASVKYKRPEDLAFLIAPSRSSFIKTHQKLFKH